MKRCMRLRSCRSYHAILPWYASKTAVVSPEDPMVFIENLACAVTRSVKPRCVAIFRVWSRQAGKRTEMSLQDPIADMLTRVRNAQKAKKVSVEMPASKQKAKFTVNTSAKTDEEGRALLAAFQFPFKS